MIQYTGTLLEVTASALFTIIALTIVVMFLFASVKVIKGLAKEI